MKLLGSVLLALSLFTAPTSFANHHEGDMKKEAKSCNCAEGKCDGSCKGEKEGHKCTGGDSCKEHGDHGKHKGHDKHDNHGKKDKKG